MKWLSVFFGVLSGFSAAAVQVSEQRLESGLQKVHANFLAQNSGYSLKQISHYLAEQSNVERILLSNEWLNQLGRVEKPSAKQREWVTSLLMSNESLFIADPDHPERQLTVVDIKQLAKTTLQLWEIKQIVERLNLDWQNGTFDWANVKSERVGITQAAMVNWIKQLSAEQVGPVASHFKTEGLGRSGKSNRLLAAMAERSGSVELTQLLFERDTDEFSYPVLQRVTKNFDGETAIDLLLDAAQNEKLHAQALLQLTKSYSDVPRVQMALLALFDDKKSRWIAGTIATQFGHPEFKRMLAQRLQGKSDPFAVFVTSAMEETHQ